MKRTIVFDTRDQMRTICGVNDRNVGYIELLLSGELSVYGNSITYQIPNEDGQRKENLFVALIERLKKDRESMEEISEPQIFMSFQDLRSQQGPDTQEQVAIAVGPKLVYPKTLHQRKFITQMEKKQLNFAIGPAGTGKTFLAIAYGLKEVLSGRKQKIILTRPVVEAGENLGFLPGDLNQKLSPYLLPIYDAMEFLVSRPVLKRLEESGAIESAPLAYMRGRSFNNAFVLLDEAQNTTMQQMKMFLTRLGEHSKAVVTGDITQIDLPGPERSGLVHARSILHTVSDIGFIEFCETDVVRSRLVQSIIRAYEQENHGTNR
ncbi:MAG: PhoH family protein [Sphaerochaetaceae bacterium]|nr:PhoH family protein [Sphaerochaetaceae bacterium]